MVTLLMVFLVCLGLLLPLRAQTTDGLPLCPQQMSGICLVDRRWSYRELPETAKAVKVGGGQFFMGSPDQLTLIVRNGSDQSPALILYGTTPMQRVEATQLWSVTIHFDGVQAAILSVGIRLFVSKDSQHFQYPFLTWYGPDAPQAPPANVPLKGELRTVPFSSSAFGGRRGVHVYLPPKHDPAPHYPVVYMADGELLPDYAAVLDYLIVEGQVAPVIVVGIVSSESQPENLRGQELMPGRNPQRFGQNERLFTHEVRLWAERTFGASTGREQRAIMGMSNGGLFALAMIVQHPDLYGVVFPFSAGASGDFDPATIAVENLRLLLRIYSTAGTLEPIFLDTTRAYLKQAAKAGAETVLIERVSGHDNANWLVTFAEAVQWAFPAR